MRPETVEDITRFPPLVQLVCLGLLAAYVLVSIIGRLSPRFRWIWRDPRKRHRLGHILEYTLLPAAVLAVAGTAVVYGWDYRVPLDGGWTALDLILGPGAALLGGLLIVAAGVLGPNADERDPKALRSWLPFILVIAGMVLMSVGLFRFSKKGASIGKPHSSALETVFPAATRFRDGASVKAQAVLNKTRILRDSDARRRHSRDSAALKDHSSAGIRPSSHLDGGHARAPRQCSAC